MRARAWPTSGHLLDALPHTTPSDVVLVQACVHACTRGFHAHRSSSPRCMPLCPGEVKSDLLLSSCGTDKSAMEVSSTFGVPTSRFGSPLLESTCCSNVFPRRSFVLHALVDPTRARARAPTRVNLACAAWNVLRETMNGLPNDRRQAPVNNHTRCLFFFLFFE